MEKYWMCHNHRGDAPRAQHINFESAKQEAERLCRISGQPIYLLECVAVVEVDVAPVKWSAIDELPFE